MQKLVDSHVMIDHRHMLLRLKVFPNYSAQIAFDALYSSWVSIFDAPSYVFVNRGSNLAAELLKRKLPQIEAQLCPNPTEAP